MKPVTNIIINLEDTIQYRHARRIPFNEYILYYNHMETL